MVRRTRLVVGLAAASIVALAGCGGGSGGTGSSLRSVGKASVLITDGFREDYDHVWATIYHVELVPAAGTNNGANVVVYDNAAGVTVDLKTLRDSTGAIFSFLGSASIPAGTYTAANITIGSSIQLVLKGATSGTSYTVDSSVPRDANGNAVLTDTFKKAKTIGSTTNNVIIDFNLANFVIKGSKILPAVQDGDPTGIGDPSRQQCGAYYGAVSNLTGTAPVLTFTLTTPGGSTQTVVTTASTALYGATLANASNVAVLGTLDTTTQNLVATRIQVLPVGSPVPGSGANALQLASGTASALDATAGTLTLTVTHSCGFTPSSTSISIVTNSSTVFRNDAGSAISEADFFSALATTSSVDVSGTYDSTTGTLTATTVSIDNPANNGGWEHDQHNFRPGGNAGNWGNDAFGHH